MTKANLSPELDKMLHDAWVGLVLPELVLFANSVSKEQARYDVVCTLLRKADEFGLQVDPKGVEAIYDEVCSENDPGYFDRLAKLNREQSGGKND